MRGPGLNFSEQFVGAAYRSVEHAKIVVRVHELTSEPTDLRCVAEALCNVKSFLVEVPDALQIGERIVESDRHIVEGPKRCGRRTRCPKLNRAFEIVATHLRRLTGCDSVALALPVVVPTGRREELHVEFQQGNGESALPGGFAFSPAEISTSLPSEFPTRTGASPR